MSNARKTSSLSGLGPSLKDLRLSLGLGQAEFARELGTDAGTLSKWESGVRNLPLAAAMKTADLAPIEKRRAWLESAGLSAPTEKKRDTGARPVPVLMDFDSLGTVRASEDKERSRIWEIPKEWLPTEGVLYAVRAPDEGMNPLISKGFMVVVDISKRDPQRLHNTMVAARDAKGGYIRWLRRDMGLDLLVPEDLRGHGMKPLKGHILLGEVVLWLGKPIEQG